MSLRSTVLQRRLGAIVILEFSDQKDLVDTFSRVAEFYEGRELKDKLDITHEEVLKQYEEDWGGRYAVDGFNAPVVVVDEFLWPKVNNVIQLPLSSNIRADANDHERQFLNLNGCTYVIGVVAGDNLTLDHELSHALYYTDRVYKINCNIALVNSQVDQYLQPLYEMLYEHGYHADVWTDEVIAWIIEDDYKHMLDEGKWVRNGLRKLRTELTGHYINALARIGGI